MCTNKQRIKQPENGNEVNHLVSSYQALTSICILHKKLSRYLRVFYYEFTILRARERIARKSYAAFINFSQIIEDEGSERCIALFSQE